MENQVPVALKNWFIFHCIVDLALAIPMFCCPEWFLDLVGWPFYDPLTVRLVAAALIGIGLESYLGRNAGAEHYRGMLRLKLIWPATATLGILITMLGLPEPPVVGWFLAGFVAAFNVLWLYWYRRLSG